MKRGGRARQAVKDGAVVVTDRDKPAHGLPGIEAPRRLTKRGRNVGDSLAMPGAADIEFEAPRVIIGARPADLSS